MSFDEEIRDIRKKMIEMDLNVLKDNIKEMNEIIVRVEDNINRLVGKYIIEYNSHKINLESYDEAKETYTNILEKVKKDGKGRCSLFKEGFGYIKYYDSFFPPMRNSVYAYIHREVDYFPAEDETREHYFDLDNKLYGNRY